MGGIVFSKKKHSQSFNKLVLIQFIALNADDKLIFYRFESHTAVIWINSFLFM